MTLGNTVSKIVQQNITKNSTVLLFNILGSIKVEKDVMISVMHKSFLQVELLIS